MAKEEFLFMMDADDKRMLRRLAGGSDHSMAWVLRKLVRKAHQTCFDVNGEGDPFAEAGLR